MSVEKEVEIKDGIKHKCPNCNRVYMIENEKEKFFVNICIVYITEKIFKVKCKQCKSMITIDRVKNPL